MPTGEVDTSAVASAVLQSGTQLLFRFRSLLLLRLPLFPFFFFFESFFLVSLILPTRKESVRAEGGCYTPGWDGRIQNLRR
jgi:hypothetical protein